VVRMFGNGGIETRFLFFEETAQILRGKIILYPYMNVSVKVWATLYCITVPKKKKLDFFLSY
jgi:hypothetical protein